MSDIKSRQRVLRLRANNFKNLVAVDIEPKADEHLLRITGPNGAGKTSVLDAVMAAVCGGRAAPAQPIRHGEVRADIVVNTDQLILTREFTPGGSRLTVTTRDGLPLKTPQAVLDSLIGDLSFDPLEFMRMKPKEQLNRLLEICPIGLDLDALEKERQEIFNQRTLVNRDVEKTKGMLANYTDVPEERPQEVDVSAVLAERKAREEQLAQITDAEGKRLAAQHEAIRLATDLRLAKETVEELRKKLQAAEEAVASIQQAGRATKETEAAYAKFLSENPRPTFEDLDAQLQQSAELTAAAQRFDQRDDLAGELATYERQSADYSAQLLDLESKKRDSLAGANLPIAGLALGEEGLTFNNVPLSQCCTAEQIKVAVALAIAANPNLRFIRINDGSLLDSANRAVIEQMLVEHDAYAWMEEVDESGAVGIVIEEGRVVSHAG